MTLLVASITCESPATADADASAALRAGANAIEWRVDGYEGDAAALRSVIARFARWPMIVTCRASAEGGAFTGDTMQRVSRLIELARGTGAFVDFEFADWRRSDNIRQKVLLAAADPTNGAPKLVLSHHRFDAALEHPEQAAAAMSADGRARVIKLAWKARDICDNLAAFDLMRDRGSVEAAERVVICMGEEGQPSRVLARKFSAWGTYAAADQDKSTAPGQLTVAQLVEDFRWDTIGADTEWYGVIGDPVAHSRSPMLFNRLFARHEPQAVYLPLRVTSEDALERWLSGVRQRPWLGAKGFSVTLPHKSAALRLADGALDEQTRRIGAANTLVLRDDRWLACNTDAPAAVESLCAALAVLPVELRGLGVDVLGAGGAARAVVAGLVDVGARVTLFGRNIEATQALARAFRCTAGAWDDRASGQGEVLVNATSVGMWPRVDESPMAGGGFAHRKLVFDLIYNPLRTRLLADAEQAGVATLSGLDMFARQAAMQFKLWTGWDADLAAIREWVRASLTADAVHMNSRSNVVNELLPSIAGDAAWRVAPHAAMDEAPQSHSLVLIGYRGSGKSIVARLAGRLLRRRVVDTDELIVAREGRTIRDIFERDGEAHFRRIEAEVIAGLSCAEPSIISVGGGAIENERSVAALRHLGFVVWLTASPETLHERIQRDANTEAQRPGLTAMFGLDEVRAVLARREPLYRLAADIEVSTDGRSAKEVAGHVLHAWASARGKVRGA